MPLPFVQTSTDNFTGGLPYNRFRGVVLSGQLETLSPAGGPLPPPGGFACIQSTAAVLPQMIATTAATGTANYFYITQGTVSVTSSTNTTIAAAPPLTGMGAALYYDTARKKICVFSTVTNDWLGITVTSS